MIDCLANQPNKIKDVATLIYETFVQNGKSNMTYEEVYAFFQQTKEKSLPLTLVAIEENECVGTVSVFENDLKIRRQYKPWLASLVVVPAYRGRGIAERLIHKAEKIVEEMGYTELYLRTEDASMYYQTRGWCAIETVCDSYYDNIQVFIKFLNKEY